jgi:hypothetical protein
MIHLPGVLAAAEEVEQLCQQQGWRFCFIGGVAVQRWGEPRLTQDVDLTLMAGFGREEAYVDACLSQLRPRRGDAREFALKYRVLLVRTVSGVDVDIALGGLPFEERSIQRSSTWTWDATHALTTCSAEDLVTHKSFAGRDLDWSDVERVLTRQHGKLDLGLIRVELKPLLDLKGEGQAMDRLERMIVKVDQRVRTQG